MPKVTFSSVLSLALLFLCVGLGAWLSAERRKCRLALLEAGKPFVARFTLTDADTGEPVSGAFIGFTESRNPVESTLEMRANGSFVEVLGSGNLPIPLFLGAQGYKVREVTVSESFASEPEEVKLKRE